MFASVGVNHSRRERSDICRRQVMTDTPTLSTLLYSCKKTAEKRCASTVKNPPFLCVFVFRLFVLRKNQFETLTPAYLTEPPQKVINPIE
jgi:hypothetical protein